jgi:ATP-dependent DNA helicase RecG
MNNAQLIKLLEKLVTLPSETDWVEFKVNKFDQSEWFAQKIWEIISWLSNTASISWENLWYLVFWVEDSTHEIKWTNLVIHREKVKKDDLEHRIMQRLNPKINLKIHSFRYEEKSMVIFEVPPATDRPVSFFNEEYIRIASITRKLKDFPEKEKQIWNNWISKRIEKWYALNWLDLDIALNLIDYNSYFELMKQNLPWNKNLITEKLIEEWILKEDNGLYNITNLWAILFAKNFEDFPWIKRKSVRVIIYNWNNRVVTLKEKPWYKWYAVWFENLIEYINDQLPSNEEITKAFRKENKMYPEIAIRELVANALIHQDFSESWNGPMIEIFNDRIEISNPWKPLIDTDRFIDHAPKSRNEDIASFMRRINICEERGSWIDKVIFFCELFQLPAPKFEAIDHITRVTLYSYKKLTNMDKKDRIRACYQHCVLKYVSNETMTNTSLRERFKISDENSAIASRIISETLDAHKIKPNDPESKSKKHIKYIPSWAS